MKNNQGRLDKNLFHLGLVDLLIKPGLSSIMAEFCLSVLAEEVNS